MGFFRRRQETLNEQLLRQAGLDPSRMLGDAPPPPQLEQLDPLLSMRPRQVVPEGASPNPRVWDAAVTVSASDLVGDEIRFTTIPNGDVIVSEETSDADLSPLADAVEEKIDPPYRAVASRQDGDLWGVGAKRIRVTQFQLVAGDAVELSLNDGVQEVRVDGEPSDAEIPELERLGEQAGTDYCVEAKRIDGNFWEVEVSAL